MITARDLEIYLKYKGDGDAWQSHAPEADRRGVGGGVWIILEQIHQRLTIVKQGIASTEFIRETHQLVRDHFDNEDTVQLVTETLGGCCAED